MWVAFFINIFCFNINSFWTVIDKAISDVQELFTSFHQAELDSNCKESIFTLENVIKEFPELREIPCTFLNEELKDYLVKYNDELTEPDIWYWGDGVSSKGLEFITLFEACKKWNIIMEVYSEEGGCQFQEHYICDKGDIICERI